MRSIRIMLAVLLTALAATAAHAAPWIHDTNQNKIDDRIEAVQVNGLAAAHVHNDLNAHWTIHVFNASAPFDYGVYVAYDHHPSDADVAALQATGAHLLWRPRFIDYLRARISYAQIQTLAGFSGVRRVEAWEMMYRTNDNATRTFRARDAAGGVGAGMFPSVWKDLGDTGHGVVVGIIDDGVNDQPFQSYPGHESLLGKFVGGGDYSNPDASLNTPPDSSTNPRNNADPEGDYHATHVAGTAIGTGGPSGFYAGMAPGAALVDLKALSDAGEGGGAADALEWCMVHKDTVWGLDPVTGQTLKGVQVVNMSLGGATASDGTDADCAAVNAAMRAGIVVCVATGNDGNTGYMPSPAAADDDISVGALTDANTLQHTDDIVADYSNEGPRETDGDADHYDEMKPAICGSGSDIMSALGDPSTDGTHYHPINGTSMATPTITGLVALIRSANPSLTPEQVRDIVQNTAEHRTDHGKQPPSASDPFHIDPNYHPSWGWGEPDAYAAVKEALDPTTTQVVSEAGTAALLGSQLQIAVRWVTQREIGVSGFRVYRAGDLGGFPGDFAAVSPGVTPAGHPTIERTSNRTPYDWTDTDPTLVAGAPYWYEVRWTDSQSREHVEPAFQVKTQVKPVRARVQWAITHNALDNDITARIGSGTDVVHPAFVRATGGSGAADSSVVVVPVGFGSMTEYFFHTDLTDDDLVGSFLPPSTANPWFYSAYEQGFVNTEGIVDSFSVTVYGPGNTTTVFRSSNPPQATAETQTTTFWIPGNPVTTLNHNPVLDPIGGKSTSEGVPLSFTISGSDPDNQAITFAVTGLPAGASFSAGTRTFSWTPGYGQAGSYGVTFHVTDSMGAADSERVTITVNARAQGSNSPPVLAPISDKTTQSGHVLSFAVNASDPDGGPLSFSATPLPAGAALDGTPATFHWTPDFGQEGTYRVQFAVTDNGGAVDSQAVLIHVTAGSIATLPESCTPDTTVYSGTIGADVQGAQGVFVDQPFTVAAGVQKIEGLLNWTGGPAIDLDLYLLDPNGNTVGSGATATNDPEVATYETPSPGTYTWHVVSFDNPNPNEAWTVTSIQCHADNVAGVGPTGAPRLALAQNMPNPFARSSVIRFSLPTAGPVTLGIYDVSGRLVRTLVHGTLEAGYHQRVWDGRSERGDQSHPGVYFYTLQSGSTRLSRRMVMLH